LRLIGNGPAERKLQALLWRALASEEDRLPLEQAALVREFIKHDEYELAVDQWRDALDNLDVEPCPEAAQAMEGAAAIMGVKGNAVFPVWRRTSP
jgi:hypothetical protein